MKIVQRKYCSYDRVGNIGWENGAFPYQSLADYKYSLETKDGNIVQAGVFEVLIGGKVERHACISSQAGCKFSCAMCSSGKSGFKRNLEADEIVEEINQLSRAVGVESFEQLIFMGIGEPLDNMDNFVDSISKLLTEKPQYAGRISFASVGLPEKIRSISSLISSRKIPPFRMVWWSLHAADDKKRSSIMPVNKLYGIAETLDVFRGFSRKHAATEVWANYLVFEGFNNGSQDANKLAALLGGTENEISLMISEANNDIPGFKRADRESLYDFADDLKRAGVKNRISIFTAAGKDVGAGCGEFIFKPAS